MPTFAEALYNLSAERLRALAGRRGVDPKRLALVPDKRQLAQFLAGDFSRPPSIVQAILQCNARHLRLLQILNAVETRQSIPWRTMLDAVGGPQLNAAISGVVTGLEDLGLAFRVNDTVFVPDALRHQIPASLSDRYTLSRCLQSYDAPTVKRICERLNLTPSTKVANVENITRFLLSSDKENTRKLNLNETELAALEYIAQSGGAATPAEVASAILNSTEDFFRYDWQNRWKTGKERNAVDSLLARGLIYVIPHSYGFNLYLVMPGDLLRSLTEGEETGFWTAPPPKPALLSDPPATVTRQTSLIRDIVSLLGYVSTQEAVRTNTGHIHKTSLKNMARMLSAPSERYASFLYAVCREAGLIAVGSEKQSYHVTPQGLQWLQEAPDVQTRVLLEAWRQSDLWGEMFAEPLKRGSEYRHKDAVLNVRKAALDLLAEAPDGGVADITSLTEALIFRFPLLLAHSSQLGGELVPSPSHFIRLIVAECLAWLGVVELGWKEGPPQTSADSITGTAARARGAASLRGDPAPAAAAPEPVGFRFTPMGAYLLGHSQAEPPESPPLEEQFIVQANAEIFIPPYLDPLTLYHLLLITDVPGKGSAGNMVSITRESVRRALDLGLSGKEFLAFLQEHGRTGIPQNVEYLINEVAGKHGHIHIGKAQMYVQVDSPVVLKELQARREIKDYFVRALNDTIAILKADDADKLLRDLRKAGYFPISDDAPRQSVFKINKKTAAVKRTAGVPAASKPGKPRLSVDTALDWGRMTQEDGKLWNESRGQLEMAEFRPDNAVYSKENIRALLVDCIQLDHAVQLSYQGQGDLEPRDLLAEPLRVMGNFVNVYLPITEEEETLNINRIAWARPAGDILGID